mmetsp:Transcript_110898/g.236874  ORF Transcript_110898/g.236874 Transcript_110898/m.236874 type:complete len:520 (-) Transcript_110898:170-1729(-)
MTPGLEPHPAMALRCRGGRSCLGALLRDLAAHPGHLQVHADAALKFKERRSHRAFEAKLDHQGPEANEVTQAHSSSQPLLELSAPPQPSASVDLAGGDCEGRFWSKETEVSTVASTTAGDSAALSDDDELEGERPVGFPRHVSEPAPWSENQCGLTRECRTEAQSLDDILASLCFGDDAQLEGQWPEDVLELLETPGCTPMRPLTSGDIETQGRLQFMSGTYGAPHPDKASTGGADSCFIDACGVGLGIADGVGEWEWRFGLDARGFADELMAGCQAEIRRLQADTSLALGARERALHALHCGFRSTRSFGSSTALVACLARGGHRLGVANLGDSALLLLRRREGDMRNGLRCVGRTRMQQHLFNCPYQLALLPTPADFPELLQQGKEKLVRFIEGNRKAQQDTPEHAELYSFPVREGDLLVLGTDGIFDNLYVPEVCQLAARAVSPTEAPLGCGPTDPARLAEAIVRAAAHRSRDRRARTPFSDHAQRAGLQHQGGKMDDITCVCAWVAKAPCDLDAS